MTMHSDAIGRLDRLWERLLQGLGLAACALIGLMVLLICADVGARAFALGNLPWAAEMAEYALYLCTFLAAPWLLRQGRHVRMDMVLRALPATVSWALELAADALAAATCTALAAASFKAAIASAEQGSLVLKIFVFPEWWLVAPAAAMFAVLAVEFLFRLRRQWRGPRAVRDEATSAA
ncbi:TRAP transporter small permease [Azohydromonas caseinilytica]|uniref:TRAP transporter small permease protein n=1 Tax=Azohydromonas caseinilytica TaxID=2728836 RepID=A0A848FEQ1_9BURK|nr:TRAP transporter small permease [Azohydromonas caseinilytica]NML16743.1 TRAP transporter small permease [Azohydromonas caseinilytica]